MKGGWFMAGGGRRSSKGGGGLSGVIGGVSSVCAETVVKADGGGGHYVPITREPTAEMLSPAGDKREAENHQNADGEVFMKRLERLLLPAFCEKSGEGKGILILASLLRDLGVGTIIVQDNKGVHNGFAVLEADARFARAPRGATLE